MPLPFGSQYLYQHYAATGWDPDAQYPQLTKPSRALLDFGFLPGVHFSLSQAPVPQFANSASLSALTGPLVEDVDAAAGTTTSEGTATGTMKGSLAYMASSSGAVHVRSSRDASVADVVERFRLPALPDVKGKGKASSQRHSLLYGRFHLPSYRLDALYSKRLTETTEALLTLVSLPPPVSRPLVGGLPPSVSSSAYLDAPPLNPPGLFSLSAIVSQDNGTWASQYSYSTVDGLVGARLVHHFGAKRLAQEETAAAAARQRIVDEEDAMENVLRGRFSVGGEVYFSAQEKSAGVSTGIRFATIPDPPGAPWTQPPTVLSATLNPIMGHISAAYAANVSRDVALATRFDFNSFSFDSDLTVGVEWLQRRPAPTGRRRRPSLVASARPLDGVAVLDAGSSEPTDRSGFTNWFWKAVGGGREGEVVGVVKARASPNSGIGLMWQGKWRDCFVGLGMVADLTDRKQPVRSLGLELQYLRSG